MNRTPARRVLVADDAATITMLLSAALSDAGLEVVTADNGLSAFELGCQPGVDLAIIDQLMPGLLGTEVLEKWRSEGVEFPVIMLSGIDDETTVVDSLQLGAVDFVRKPFLIGELRARVGLALRSKSQ